MVVSLQQAALQAAQSQVGYVEGRGNRTKYAAEIYPAVQGAAWCGVFVAWCYQQAGYDMRPHVWAPFVPYLEDWARRIGAWTTDRAQTGDLVIYGFGHPSGQHVGIAWPDEQATGYRAIEGNTSPGSAGSQANGGGVYVRYRGRPSIRGWVRMSKVLEHYGVRVSVGHGSAGTLTVDPGKRTTGTLDVDGVCGKRTAQEIQQRLGVTVDGVIGPDTLRAWQRHEGTPVDGKISGQNAYCRKHMPGVRADCIGMDGRGSTLIRTVQTNLNRGGAGLTVDGLAGPAFWKALQAEMNRNPQALR